MTSPHTFETRLEWLRPPELAQRRARCPLVFLPLGPLEYHGPHLPLGTDGINASRMAHACCRKLHAGVAGHAALVETSLMMHYDARRVDLQTLPPRHVPIRYPDFSIVDGPGFTPHHDPDHVVRHDPRDAHQDNGCTWFHQAVNEMAQRVRDLIRTTPPAP